jgi:hypothetical protein
MAILPIAQNWEVSTYSFGTAAAMVENQPKVQSAFKTGRGVAWGD